jgi:hypothetical protein
LFDPLSPDLALSGLLYQPVSFLTRIRSVALSSGTVVALSVAAITFVTAYDDGSYWLPSRNTLAIAFWWAVIVGVALSTLTLESATRASLVLGGIIAALCAWTLASMFWAPSAENSFNEFNRVSLFLGLFVVTTLAARRASFARWLDGLAIGITLVALIALVSRFFPGTFSDQGLGTFLQSVAHRLSFPLGYWNGLAIFVALGLPLLLRIAVTSERAILRGLAVAPVPAIVSVVFLASSRGGVITALVGIVTFILLIEQRWSAVAALLWGAAGSAAAIIALDYRHELVNGPMGTSLVKHEGRSAALLVALFCLLAGAGYAAGREAASRLGRKKSFQPKPWFGPAAAALAITLAVVGIIASHPLGQFNEFRRPPSTIPTGDFAKQHLLSTSGSGRWQFWTASIDQWEHHPLLGNGGGSYEAWWTKHRPAASLVAKDAHSLYIQSLGELGIPGLALTLSLALIGIGVGVRRSRQASGEKRVALAALTGTFAAFSVAAGFDWIWELTAVTGVGIVALALLGSAAGTTPGPPQLVRANGSNGSRHTRQKQFGIGLAALLGAWLLICAQAIPLFSQLRLKDSQTYAERAKVFAASGDTTEAFLATTDAFRAAMDARNLQPWAAGPYLQLALVREQQGAYALAHEWIRDAIARDPTDWHIWFAAADIEIRLGDTKSASRSLRRAISLNPRSTLFTGIPLENSAVNSAR